MGSEMCIRDRGKGCALNDSKIKQICEFYELLSSRFDRTERVHFQLSENISQLYKADEELNDSLEKI